MAGDRPLAERSLAGLRVKRIKLRPPFAIRLVRLARIRAAWLKEMRATKCARYALQIMRLENRLLDLIATRARSLLRPAELRCALERQALRRSRGRTVASGPVPNANFHH